MRRKCLTKFAGKCSRRTTLQYTKHVVCMFARLQHSSVAFRLIAILFSTLKYHHRNNHTEQHSNFTLPSHHRLHCSIKTYHAFLIKIQADKSSHKSALLHPRCQRTRKTMKLAHTHHNINKQRSTRNAHYTAAGVLRPSLRSIIIIAGTTRSCVGLLSHKSFSTSSGVCVCVGGEVMVVMVSIVEIRVARPASRAASPSSWPRGLCAKQRTQKHTISISHRMHAMRKYIASLRTLDVRNCGKCPIITDIVVVVVGGARSSTAVVQHAVWFQIRGIEAAFMLLLRLLPQLRCLAATPNRAPPANSMQFMLLSERLKSCIVCAWNAQASANSAGCDKLECAADAAAAAVVCAMGKDEAERAVCRNRPTQLFGSATLLASAIRK